MPVVVVTRTRTMFLGLDQAFRAGYVREANPDGTIFEPVLLPFPNSGFEPAEEVRIMPAVKDADDV